MNLERYIQIYDDILKPEAISSLIKWCNQQNFEEATVVNINLFKYTHIT